MALESKNSVEKIFLLIIAFRMIAFDLYVDLVYSHLFHFFQIKLIVNEILMSRERIMKYFFFF